MRRSWWFVVLVAGCGSVGSNEKMDAAVVVDTAVSHDVAPDTPPTCAPTPSGLKARYLAENNANDKTGTFNGVATGTNFTYTTGKYGAAFLLDGSDDKVVIDDGDLLWASGSFTLEAWIKATTLPAGTSSIIAKYACGNQCVSNMSNAYFALYLSQNGRPGLDFRPDSPSQDITSIVASAATVNDGNWHHIVGVRDATAQMGVVYVDGALAASASPAVEQFGPMTNADSDNDRVVIGGTVVAGQTSYTNLFPGAIDEVAVYHSALTAAQVAAIYAAADGKCP
jgi:hypothetical protein